MSDMIYYKEQTVSQRMLADQLQLIGIDLDKNAIQKIESGKRFVTDIEIVAFAKVFHITANELLECVPTGHILK